MDDVARARPSGAANSAPAGAGRAGDVRAGGVRAGDARTGGSPGDSVPAGAAVVDEPVTVDGPVRLDVALVRRGLARSRGEATMLVSAGRVRVGGTVARRPSSQIGPAAEVIVERDDDPGYASRAAHKLVGALDATGIVVDGRDCLDAGASTGGFTDVLLRRGARRVLAVDVGHGQIVDRLRDDPRVEVREGVNVRDLDAATVDPSPSLVVADLSFISLALVLPALAAAAAPHADLLVMVKPQFEVGRERLGSGGVVRDPRLRAQAVLDVARAAADVDLGVLDVVRSPLPGPSGNVEYFLWLRRAASGIEDLESRVRAVVAGTDRKEDA